MGQADKAQALEQQIVAAGGDRRARPAGRAAGSTDLMNVGVNLYNDKKYAEAAAAFEKVVAAEPYNRDALSNLANTYLAMKDGPKLVGHGASSSSAHRAAERERRSSSWAKATSRAARWTTRSRPRRRCWRSRWT